MICRQYDIYISLASTSAQTQHHDETEKVWKSFDLCSLSLYKLQDMGVTTATKLCETSTVKANTGTDEIVSKSVLFLERYCQTRMVAKNLQVDTSYHVAAKAISPIAIEGTNCPVDKSVGF